MERRFVDSVSGLQELCADLAPAGHLALDTEFLREKTYYPKLCLLQVCGKGIAACVDPLAIEDLTPLLDLLSAPSRVKVWHAARQDLEIFLHQWALLPAPVFDTQLAAAVLGLGDQVGYARLVQDVLRLELPKDQSRSDWCRRPLEEAQLRYAYDDVVHLEALYRELAGRLEKLGRSRWLAEDFAELTDPATYRTEPADAWQRIKGRQHLKGARLAVLQQLAAWREERAMAVDRPRRWILRDEVMVDIARRPPHEPADLGRFRGLDGRTAEKMGDLIVAAVRRGMALPKEQWPRERIPPRLAPAQEIVVDVLGAAMRVVAEANSITPAAVASRSELAKFVAGRETALDHGWRHALVGEILRKVLVGELVLTVSDGVAELRPRDR
jgi:ribonuclease D